MAEAGLNLSKTIKDYRLLPQGAPYQLIEETLIITPAPSPKHQDISRNLVRHFLNFLETSPLGKLDYVPIDVFLNKENVYQPDVVFISQGWLDIIKKRRWYS